VKKQVGATTTVMVYNVMGQLVAEYDNVNTLPLSATKYVTADHLGSTRVVTDASGSVKARYDYLPYGEELPFSVGTRNTVGGYQTSEGIRQKFTSKERDAESGLDYFLARYYSSPQGRFTGTDPVIVTPERFYDPQQFNLYAYTRNNPLRFIDPTGKILTISGDVQEAQRQLCSVLGTSDCSKRITYDAKTNTITVDVTGIDLSQNEGAALLNDLVASKNRYDLAIGSTVETLGGIISLDPKDKKNKTSTDMVNLDVNPDDRFNYRKPPGKVAKEKPKLGIDDQVAFNLAGRSPRVSDTKLKPATIESIIFHELAEAYAKIEHNKQYADAHQEAIQREQKLRNERPYLKDHNPGSGPGDRVIIKR
jgi:RHS repeat-associated protein